MFHRKLSSSLINVLIISTATAEFVGVVGIAGVVTWGNGSLTVSRAERLHEGRYVCEANNGVGAALSKVITLKVQGKFNKNNNIFLCQNI